MKQYSAACALATSCMLGESPVWHPEEQALYWVDGLAPALHRFVPAVGRHDTAPMPADVGCLAIAAGGGLVVALRTGLYHLDALGAPLRLLCPAPFSPAQTRFNDGRCDRTGRFWAGSLYEPRSPALAALYRYDPAAGFIKAAEGFTVSNGVAWSPDGSVMYHADTPQLQVWAYDFDQPSGGMQNRRLFLDFRKSGERPDGACIDAEGNYWLALYGSGCVAQFSPRGERMAEVRLPVKAPTMPALGGPDLRTLYITSARQKHTEAELTAMPLAGGLFACEVEIPGLPEPRCRL